MYLNSEEFEWYFKAAKFKEGVMIFSQFERADYSYYIIFKEAGMGMVKI